MNTYSPTEMFMLPRKFVGVVLRSTSVVSWWSAFLVNLEDLEYRCKVKALQDDILPYSNMILSLTTYPQPHPYGGKSCNDLCDTKNVFAPHHPRTNLFPLSLIVPFCTQTTWKSYNIYRSHSVFLMLWNLKFPFEIITENLPVSFQFMADKNYDLFLSS